MIRIVQTRSDPGENPGGACLSALSHIPGRQALPPALKNL
jgi:hypothetical protein